MVLSSFGHTLLASAAFAALLSSAACSTNETVTPIGTGGGGGGSTNPSGGGGGGGGGPPKLPTDLDPGWNEIAPGGKTICSRGSDYAYFVRPGKVNKLIVDFIGGGACWNELTCSVAGATFSESVDDIRERIQTGAPAGIYDHERDENPFKDWYHVVIPYCTGDIHWGDAVKTYGEGLPTEVTINHKGAVNSRAVLDWVYENFSAPEDILVTGCSAGSYGSAMWAPHIMNHYPKARVTQFGDSGAGVITDEFFQDSFPSWNAGQAFPSFIPALDPARVDIEGLELADLYAGVGDFFPKNRVSQYNTAFDDNQTLYFTFMGGSGADEWSERMFASMARIQRSTKNFASLVPTGEQHFIVLFDNFYTVNVEGKLLTDWIHELLGETVPDSEACTGDPCHDPTP
jgi:hypothetical protein